MEPKQRTFSMWYTVVAMLVLLGIQAFLLVPHPESMSYSEFKALLRAGKVSELGLRRDTIEGTFSPTGLEGVLSESGDPASSRGGCPSRRAFARRRRGTPSGASAPSRSRTLRES
jgi:cell division protease FtsH